MRKIQKCFSNMTAFQEQENVKNKARENCQKKVDI